MGSANPGPLFANCWIFIMLAAQTPTIIPLSAESHHHLVLHNEYVNVYKVEVAPHESVALHRHDADAISVMLGDAEVTVRTPGMQDVHQKLYSGQLRLQCRGYMHSTTIEGSNTYRNVTIELLLPQEGKRNLCATVVADEPQNCATEPTVHSTESITTQPQFETDRTRITLVRLQSAQSVKLAPVDRAQLIIVLDDAVILSSENGRAEILLKSSDFAWIDPGKPVPEIKNPGSKETRLVLFEMKSILAPAAQIESAH